MIAKPGDNSVVHVHLLEKNHPLRKLLDWRNLQEGMDEGHLFGEVVSEANGDNWMDVTIRLSLPSGISDKKGHVRQCSQYKP